MSTIKLKMILVQTLIYYYKMCCFIFFRKKNLFADG